MLYEKIEYYQKTLKELELQYWIENSLFTPTWWILLAAAIIPWLVWYKYVDRSRFLEIILFGLIWCLFAAVVDEFSSTLLLWSYPRKLFPIIPPLLPADLSVVPIIFMFIYQKTATFKMYMIWSIVASAVFSFVVEIIFVHFNLFKMYKWEHWYSFIGFIFMAAFTWWVQKKMLKVSNKSKSVT